MKKLIQSVMLCITLLLGLNTQAASQNAVVIPDVPPNLGFGDSGRFESFLLSQASGNYNWIVETSVSIYVKNTSGGQYYELGFESGYYLPSESPDMSLEILLRDTLSLAADKLLREASAANLDNDVRFAIRLGENFYGTNTFRVDKVLGSSPGQTAVPGTSYRVPSAATNEWSFSLYNKISPYIYWKDLAKAHVIATNESKIVRREITCYQDTMIMVMPIFWATNGFKVYGENTVGRLWITTTNGQVFVYDLETGYSVSSPETLPIETGIVLTNGQPHLCIRGQPLRTVTLTIRKDDLFEGSTYTKSVKLGENGLGQIPFSSPNSTMQFVVKTTYEPL